MTSSRLKDAGFCRGGNLMKFSISDADQPLHQVQLRRMIDHEVPVRVRVLHRPFERIAPKVDDVRQAQFDERLRPQRTS